MIPAIVFMIAMTLSMLTIFTTISRILDKGEEVKDLTINFLMSLVTCGFWSILFYLLH